MSRAFDLVVAGSGIAGLTAGLTGARLGLRTLVLTGDIIGGQLLSINRIDGFPGFPDGIAGYDLCPITQDQAIAAGAEIEAGELAGLAPSHDGWRVQCGGEEIAARAVVMAMGASLKELDLPGEARLRGKGVSHCASCDAPLLRDKVAIVIGGGDSAAQEALTLAESAARITIVHRGAELSAQAAYRTAVAANPKIALRFHCEAVEVLGDTRVTGLRVRDKAAGGPTDLETAGLFIYIGLQPNSAAIAGAVALDARGAVVTDGRMRTERPGLCAVGAVRSGWLGRAAISAGEGANAAIAAAEFLAGGAWRE